MLGKSKPPQKIKQNALAILKRLEYIQEIRDINEDEQAEWETTKKQLDDLYLDEETYWKHRSRPKWLEEGYFNTKYVHKIATHRHNK